MLMYYMLCFRSHDTDRMVGKTKEIRTLCWVVPGTDSEDNGGLVYLKQARESGEYLHVLSLCHIQPILRGTDLRSKSLLSEMLISVSREISSSI